MPPFAELIFPNGITVVPVNVMVALSDYLAVKTSGYLHALGIPHTHTHTQSNLSN